jgi:hypothetical protein
VSPERVPLSPSDPVVVSPAHAGAVERDAYLATESTEQDRAETISGALVYFRRGRYLVALLFGSKGPPQSPPPPIPAAVVSSIAQRAAERIPA